MVFGPKRLNIRVLGALGFIFRVEGFGFRVLGPGFGVLGCGVDGCFAYCLGFRVSGSVKWAW